MKAREVFEKYPDVECIVKGLYGISLIKTEPYPDVGRGYWTFSVLLSDINEEIDEFQNKQWTDCKISRDKAMKEDCCEWTEQDSEKKDGTLYFASCLFSHYFRRKGTPKSYCFTYCPYCGKKIKEGTK